MPTSSTTHPTHPLWPAIVPAAYVDAVQTWARCNGVTLQELSTQCGYAPQYLTVAFSRIRSGARKSMHPAALLHLQIVTGLRVEEFRGVRNA
jgi:hypothetical protein